MKPALFVAGASLAWCASRAGAQQFTVTDTSVRQGRFSAVALSRDTIVSSYPRAAREVRFRFSINGLENEFPGGTEHTIWLRPVKGRLVTRTYVFGNEHEPPPPTPEQSASSEDGSAALTFRVDARGVLQAIREKGSYSGNLGAPVTHIEHLYVLGDPAPLSWDYAVLKPGSPLELHDADGDGIYEGTVRMPTQYTRPATHDGRGIWARSMDVGMFPQLTSSQRIQDATYRMSLEELRQLVRPDGALSAGAKWEGVWTRDISLSTILSLAIVAPDAVKRSLMAKVDTSDCRATAVALSEARGLPLVDGGNDRSLASLRMTAPCGHIIQDTGTGGSWPVSSDRMVWALAAWELFKVTGDRAWLRTAYDVTRRSAEADLHAVRDTRTGLFNGESSFMDWREQSYPRWMQPADIYQSQNLGTNAVHYAAYRTLADMARLLGEPAARWDSIAAGVQQGMTHELWNADAGWFAQYRYGRVSNAWSPRSDAFGEALAAIYGSASLQQRRTLMTHAPVVAAGVPTFWPSIAGERFYHNGTIWPFVTAYWTWAAAEGHNTAAVQRGLDDATRSAALFLTNKENMVASTGHFEGTALNSDRQLWSVAGTLSGTYRLLFGMRFEPALLAFRPMVPPTYSGVRTLAGLRYRDATLTITVTGFGDSVKSATLDGHALARAEVPASITGEHRVAIVMNGRWPKSAVHVVESRFAPATPQASLIGDTLRWSAIAGVTRYAVLRNGIRFASPALPRLKVVTRDGLDEYQVMAINKLGDESFLSEPVRVLPGDAEQFVRPDNRDSSDVLSLTRTSNTRVAMPVNIARDGEYAIDVRYANGSGPVNTEDKVGVRTLLVDADTAGVIVLPQRGVQRWSELGWSNVIRVRLAAGTHTIVLAFTPLDENMNGRINTAMLDRVRITRVASPDRNNR